MSDETKEDGTEELEPKPAQKAGSGKGAPSHMQMDFNKNENAAALRPGFRNPGNKNSKAQKRKKKGRKK